MSTISIPVKAGQPVSLINNPYPALFSREGVDLVVTAGDSATVYIDFFAQGEGNPLPDLLLPDGSKVAGEDFLRSMNSAMDLATAAGPPSSSTASSGGSGDYADDAGTLVGGVDRLGSLGTSQWSSERESVETPFAPNAGPPGAPNAGPPGAPNAEPGVPNAKPDVPTAKPDAPNAKPDAPNAKPDAPNAKPDAVPDPEQDEDTDVASTFHTRGILGGGAESIRVILMDENGAPILGVAPADISFEFADNTYFTNIQYDPKHGALTVDLTDKGKEALADGIRFDDKLTVTANGEEYSILFVSSSDPAGDYKTGDHDFDNGASPLAEWYTYQGVQQGDVTLAARFAEIAIESSSAALIGGNGDGEEEYYNKGIVVGAMGSNLATNDDGLIRISADNEDSGVRSVIGYLDDSDGTKTIAGGTVEISASNDDKNAPYDRWTEATVGLLSHKGDVDINAQSVRISAEAERSASDPEAWWDSPRYVAGVKTGNAGEILERENQRWEPAGGGLSITGKADAENEVFISGKIQVNEPQELVSAKGEAYGVHAASSDFSLTGGALEDTFIIEAAVSGVDVEGNGDAFGLVMDNGSGSEGYEGEAVIDGKDGMDILRISATVEVDWGQATGIKADLHTVHIKNIEDIEITAKSRSPEGYSGEYNAAGIHVVGDGKGHGDVIISNADRDMKLTVNSSGVGIKSEGGRMLVDAGESLDMTVNADGTGISGSSWRESTIEIAAKELKLDINVEKQQPYQQGDAFGITGSGTVIKSDGNLDMQVDVKNALGDAYGIKTNGGANTIESQGTLDVTVHAAADGGKAYAIHTGDDIYSNPSVAEFSLTSANTDNTKSDTVDLKGAVVAGIMGTNTFETGAGSDTFLLDGDMVAGTRAGYTNILYGENTEVSYGKNILNTGQGQDVVTITGSMRTEGGANIIDTGKDDDVITLGSLDADFAIKHDSEWSREKRIYTHTYEDVQGENRVLAGDGNDTLTVSNGVNANGGINVIDMGAGEDKAVIHNGLNASTQSKDYQSEYYPGEETTREVGGRNEIYMGADDDRLEIYGGVNSTGSGENYIDMGDGDDWLEIHGNLATGPNGLIDIKMGEGNDTLILDGSILGENVKIDGGAGDDVLIYRYTGSAQGDLDGLLSLAGKVENIESLIIDMSNNNSDDQLSLDAILGLRGQGFDRIYINGDKADMVNTEGWSSSGNPVDNGYVEYTNDNDGLSILIQQQIITVSGG